MDELGIEELFLERVARDLDVEPGLGRPADADGLDLDLEGLGEFVVPGVVVLVGIEAELGRLADDPGAEIEGRRGGGFARLGRDDLGGADGRRVGAAGLGHARDVELDQRPALGDEPAMKHSACAREHEAALGRAAQGHLGRRQLDAERDSSVGLERGQVGDQDLAAIDHADDRVVDDRDRSELAGFELVVAQQRARLVEVAQHRSLQRGHAGRDQHALGGRGRGDGRVPVLGRPQDADEAARIGPQQPDHRAVGVGQDEAVRVAVELEQIGLGRPAGLATPDRLVPDQVLGPVDLLGLFALELALPLELGIGRRRAEHDGGQRAGLGSGHVGGEHSLVIDRGQRRDQPREEQRAAARVERGPDQRALMVDGERDLGRGVDRQRAHARLFRSLCLSGWKLAPELSEGEHELGMVGSVDAQPLRAEHHMDVAVGPGAHGGPFITRDGSAHGADLAEPASRPRRRCAALLSPG